MLAIKEYSAIELVSHDLFSVLSYRQCLRATLLTCLTELTVHGQNGEITWRGLTHLTSGIVVQVIRCHWTDFL